MNILYLSQYFPPEMGAPAARVYELSREWVRRGHQVTVLTAFPNHPTGVIPPEYRADVMRRELVDGIEVVRAPIYAAPNRALARRILNYVSYAASASALGPWLTRRPDVVIATSPQFLTAVAGLWVSALKRVPFVFEVRDLWPRSIVEVGALPAGSRVVRLLEWFERLLYRRASRIVVVTESFVDEIARSGVERDKIGVVTNGVDLELFSPRSQADARRTLRLPEGFLATYVGTHGMAHGLGTILEAARLLEGEGVSFLLVGEGAEKANLVERARREGVRNVVFWSQQPRDRVSTIVAASDVCLAVLRDLPLFRTVIPSKLFEFMGAGRGIVTTVDGESRRIVERAGAGVFSPPEDAAALAATLRRLSRSPAELAGFGTAGRSYVSTHYSRPALAGRYLDILEQVRVDAGARLDRPTRAARAAVRVRRSSVLAALVGLGLAIPSTRRRMVRLWVAAASAALVATAPQSRQRHRPGLRAPSWVPRVELGSEAEAVQ